MAKEAAKGTGQKAKPVTFKAQDVKNNLTFNLQSKYPDVREKAVYAAVEDLLDQGIAREDITRKDIARAIAEKRKSVPVTLGDLNKAAKARTKIEKKEQKARFKESEEKRLRKFMSDEEKKKEKNKRYWETHKDEINKERRRKYALEGNISAGGQNLLSDVIQLGTVEGESYSIQGSLDVDPKLLKELLNPDNGIVFNAKIDDPNLGIIESEVRIRLHNGVLEFEQFADEHWVPAAEYLEGAYPEVIGKSFNLLYSYFFLLHKKYGKYFHNSYLILKEALFFYFQEMLFLHNHNCLFYYPICFFHNHGKGLLK